MKGDGDVEEEDEHVDGRQSEETRHVEQRPVQPPSRLLQHLQRPKRHEETTAKTQDNMRNIHSFDSLLEITVK